VYRAAHAPRVNKKKKEKSQSHLRFNLQQPKHFNTPALMEMAERTFAGWLAERQQGPKKP